jgi:hypothetical protein
LFFLFFCLLKVPPTLVDGLSGCFLKKNVREFRKSHFLLILVIQEKQVLRIEMMAMIFFMAYAALAYQYGFVYVVKTSFDWFVWAVKMIFDWGAWAVKTTFDWGSWAVKTYLFYFTGFFLVYYPYIWMKASSEEWDTVERDVNGGTHVQRIMTNRRTGQRLEETVEKVRGRGSGSGSARKLIKTWLPCQLVDEKDEIKSRKLKNGFKTRFIAHVDTGNAANTVIRKDVFDMLYPTPARRQCAYTGKTMTIIGVTGDSMTLQIAKIKYRLDGVVGSNGRSLQCSVEAIVQDRALNACPYDFDLLLAAKDVREFQDHAKRSGCLYEIDIIRKEHFIASNAWKAEPPPLPTHTPAPSPYPHSSFFSSPLPAPHYPPPPQWW